MTSRHRSLFALALLSAIPGCFHRQLVADGATPYQTSAVADFGIPNANFYAQPQTVVVDNISQAVVVRENLANDVEQLKSDVGSLNKRVGELEQQSPSQSQSAGQ
jgi:hypothetical protein